MSDLSDQPAWQAAVAAAMTLLAAYYLWTGRIRRRGSTLTREESPLGFGCVVTLIAALAAFLWVAILARL